MSFRYMRDDLPDAYGFLSLQDKILEIMVYVDQLCREKDIHYCLMGGSALGQKRHGGFIPWDDDLDIFMTPDEYEKFRTAFNSIGDKERFYLQEWGLTDGMVSLSKVRMNGTTYIEPLYKSWDMHHGIYVDIFILHTCPNSRIKQLHQCIWAKYVITKGLANRGYNRRSGAAGVMLQIERMLPEKFLIKHGLEQVYKYQTTDTDYYCNFMGKAVFRKGIYKKEYFAGTEYAPFEKVALCVPVRLHEFLTDRFGDYMTPPPSDQIKWEQHAETWDIQHDFRETLNRKFDLLDEAHLI